MGRFHVSHLVQPEAVEQLVCWGPVFPGQGDGRGRNSRGEASRMAAREMSGAAWGRGQRRWAGRSHC